MITASLPGAQFLREGKAKVLFELPSQPDAILQLFKDDATAFNAQKKGTIQKKGEINNTVSSYLFTFLAKEGIANHFLKKISPREMLVQKVNIIPVEVVVRNRAAGSLCKRYGTPKGEKLKTPLVEYFYKSDELGDPLIGETQIYHFGWATPAQIEQLHALALKVNTHLSDIFSKLGLILVDFKLEFGTNSSGTILLADELTPDGMRLWDQVTLEPKDKDRFRQDLGKIEEAYEEVCNKVVSFFTKQGVTL